MEKSSTKLRIVHQIFRKNLYILFITWRKSDSNRQPSPCKSAALPLRHFPMKKRCFQPTCVFIASLDHFTKIVLNYLYWFGHLFFKHIRCGPIPVFSLPIHNGRSGGYICQIPSLRGILGVDPYRRSNFRSTIGRSTARTYARYEFYFNYKLMARSTTYAYICGAWFYNR